MNEHQYNCSVTASKADAAMKIAREAYSDALDRYIEAEEKLKIAIENDPTSWYSTPGKTKKEPHAPQPEFSHSYQDRRSHPI